MIALLWCTSGINQAIVSQAGDGRHGTTSRGNSILQSAPGTPGLAPEPASCLFAQHRAQASRSKRGARCLGAW